MNKKIAFIVALVSLTLSGCGDDIFIATSSLTAGDWAAVCVSGTVDGEKGCKGDVSSEAMQKINLVGHDFIGNTAISGGGENTVWIRKVGTGTACVKNSARIEVVSTNNTTKWSCGVAMPQAVLVGVDLEFMGGSNIGGEGNIAVAGSLGTHIYPHTTADTSTYANYSSNAEDSNITAYVICVSTDINDTATPFEQNPRVALSGARC